MSNLSGERGQHSQEWTETSEGAVAKNYIVYAAQRAASGSSNEDDPEGEYVIDHFHLVVRGEGTIQFFRENTETLIAEQLTDEMPVDDVHSVHEGPCHWRPGPKHDVYFTTTGFENDGDKVVVRLQTHRMSYGHGNAQEIIP